ncbi:BspA family leucine-rich repeat surface protein [Peterkaempfera bronchialis]|uniref:BspA family leucine-rich repeat surface protein n=1 Tax=Peterkaempfera bronchialis TaxID=2126346 RepID=UPI003C30CC8F
MTIRARVLVGKAWKTTSAKPKTGSACASLVPGKLVAKPGTYKMQFQVVRPKNVTVTAARTAKVVASAVKVSKPAVTTAKVSAAVSPVFGQKVALQVKSGSSWKAVSTVTVKTTGGSQTVSYARPKAVGTYRILSQKATWALEKASSSFTIAAPKPTPTPTPTPKPTPTPTPTSTPTPTPTPTPEPSSEPSILRLVFDTSAEDCDIDDPVTLSTPGADGTISWGDGDDPVALSAAPTWTFTTEGVHEVTLTGTIPALHALASGADCLTRVDRWDAETGTTDLSGAFQDASNLTSVATPPPGVTTLAYTFSGATSFNGDISGWDTSQVTTLQGTFRWASSFDQPIGGWNTAKVTNLDDTFYSASSFNQPIGGWNTSEVTSLDGTFYGASSFDQPIGNWKTSKVTSLDRTFATATAFNQPIGGWNTSKVTSLDGTFYGASSFDQPIGDWDTSHVTSLSATFSRATAFNQPIGGWNTSRVTDMSNTFSNALSFNQDLSRWNVGAVVVITGYDAGATSWQESGKPHFS